MRVYLVADGEYSDYHVCCVCSTPEKAEAAKESYNADRDIMCLEVDDFPALPPGLFPWRLWMGRNGDTKHPPNRENADNFIEKSMVVVNGEGCSLYVRVWARDKEHAIKIANEKRAQAIASGEWDRVEEETTKEREASAKRMAEIRRIVSARPRRKA